MDALRSSAAITLMALAAPALGQVTFPNCYVANANWSSESHHFTVPQPLYSPGEGNPPLSTTGTADTKFVSGSEVQLTPGFHAGDLSDEGQFHAYIAPWVGDPDDLVVITPDSAHIYDGVLQVEKWEKLELGYRLPPEYRDAIDRFFADYYSNGTSNPATPGIVNSAHDLNPYADDSLQLVMTLTDPLGQQRMKWGFYMKEAVWLGQNPLDNLSIDTVGPLAPFNIRYRFAPDLEGLWQFSLSIKAPHTTTITNASLPDIFYSGYSFVCGPPLPDNHGPLAVDTLNRRMLRFEDGTSFFGLGTNMSDIHHGSFSGNGHIYYHRDDSVWQNTMVQLHDVGGNFMRLYMMRNIFAPEWVNLGVYDAFKTPQVCDTSFSSCTNNHGWTTGYASNSQYQCWAFDRTLERARENGIYIQICVDPYPPILDYERFLWGAHPYNIHYLEPYRQPAVNGNPLDLKRFFYSYVDSLNTQSAKLYDRGAFYYWKRKYKYIMSRWGYSVNMPIIEPFNEIDQMLSYKNDDLTPPLNDPCGGATCMENRVNWTADPNLRQTLNSWITDINTFMKGEQQPGDPVHSPLGEKKLFLMSYARDVVTDQPFYLPFTNPNVDLLDVHIGLQWEWTVRNGFDASQTYRNTYMSGGLKKPFHQGEYTTYGNKDIVMVPDTTERATYQYFANYGISFHNELWASAFSGNFAAGTSWGWERVFFWPDAVKKPLPDDLNPAQVQFPPSNFLNDTNAVELGWPITIKVPNKPVHHHFKPLADLLNHPNWQANGFFDGPFSAHRHTIGTNSDETRKIECYWLLREPSKDLAIGWVHNLNAYWEKSWYMTAQNQNLLGCTSPATQSITLPGFASGDTLYVTFIPTWMNDTIRPANDTVAAVNGNVILDLSTAELHGQVGTLLDTLHSDYAFIIATVPFVKSRTMAPISDPVATGEGWDFIVYPNPAENEVHLRMPDDALRDIMLHDLLGRQVGVWRRMKGPVLTLPLSQLARGTYWIRASNDESSRTKKLIVQ